MVKLLYTIYEQPPSSTITRFSPSRVSLWKFRLKIRWQRFKVGQSHPRCPVLASLLLVQLVQLCFSFQGCSSLPLSPQPHCSYRSSTTNLGRQRHNQGKSSDASPGYEVRRNQPSQMRSDNFAGNSYLDNDSEKFSRLYVLVDVAVQRWEEMTKQNPSKPLSLGGIWKSRKNCALYLCCAFMYYLIIEHFV